MNFSFSLDNYYLMGAIALALLLVAVGAFMYMSSSDNSTADDESVHSVEDRGDEPPAAEDHQHKE